MSNYPSDPSQGPAYGSSHSPNPYQSTYNAPGVGYYGGAVQPHRGTLILVLGILSLVVCSIMGPFAWLMGSNDLKLIRSGQMDATGESTTQAGMICGIIGTVILAFQVLFFCLYVAIVAIAITAGGREADVSEAVAGCRADSQRPSSSASACRGTPSQLLHLGAPPRQ